MAFAYKKKEYEDVFEWATAKNASCFYCEDKEVAPVAISLIQEKGICQSCLNQFEIGHLETDRHVVERIAPSFRNRQEAVEWFQQFGPVHYVNVINEDGDEVYIYHFVNDADKYEKYESMIERMHRGEIFSEIDEEIICDLASSYTSLEIHEDGRFYIV
ncbi:MAG: hypothetical protein ACE3JP_05575 [Ectobacillus sp.]